MEYKNKIINGDCIEIMRQIPDASIDCIITSPPYNLLNSSGNGLKYKPKESDTSRYEYKLSNGYDTYTDDMPYGDYIQWQRDCLTEMLRLIPDNGAIFYNHKWRIQNGLLQDRKEIVDGFPVRQIIIWYRKGSINFNRSYFLPYFEVIYMICKKDFLLKKGASSKSDVWEIDFERNNEHPAPFPEDLVRQILSSVEAKSVLDPFVGSGTTAVVAKSMGMEYTGIDISSKYCQMAERRLKEINTLF